MMADNNTPLEHQNVPVAHQGLHSFLYSSDDEHNVDNSPIAIAFDGTTIAKISEWSQQTSNTKVAGVYAVLDSGRTYQYIGYSRDVLRSVEGHIMQNGTDTCTYIRVKTFKFPKRQAMEAMKKEWMAELDYTPAGNSEGGNTWARTIGETAKASMTQEEREAYEEKKLKLRKAMADPTLVDELTANNSPSEAEVERRQKLEAAVKNDDWSSVIESQKSSQP
ncbi:GIY-YIG nuclease family protein [Waterburya agarophytonicola K14]|uniref:GIY-YIG nuclease family protein n=1 Tax=Waterburya agarophytonicola KI4 TaxID=2874699 RepID=A0A964BWW8_9CYAN|nr:GIY-YIG nuclease family protein [Waterburya agarophytonicola KI4]